MHLIYFQSEHCESEGFVDWKILGLKNVDEKIQPIRHEVQVIERTFWISFWYLIFNIYLLFSAAVLYCKF
jgi:hypothetical protein